jgi:ubiquinone/menaquinone biosynthesis C-methylase UbiE
VAGTLDIRPGHSVLEVGFGGGAAIPTTLAALAGDGMLCAVDLSADMAVLAAVRLQPVIDEGALVLACGDVGALPLQSEAFDRAYAMHCHMYWPSPAAGISEMHRVLRPNGRILLAMDIVSGVRLIRWFGRAYKPAGPDRLVELLEAAGFAEVATTKLTGGTVAVLGTRGCA